MEPIEVQPTFYERLSDQINPSLVHSWNAFRNKDPANMLTDVNGYSETRGIVPTVSYSHPDHRRYSAGVDKTLATAIYTRIVNDCAAVHWHHVRTDESGMFVEEIKSGLNEVLTISSNVDQTPRAMIADFVMSMLDDGVAALVPVDTSVDPNNGAFDVHSVRVGRIVDWRPRSVRVRLYNDRTGKHEEIRLAKEAVAIVENPFYSVMNEPNSILRRLTRKLNQLDFLDEQISSSKLDLIIQLPYVVKNATKQKQAEERRKQIEEQLVESKYGIAYTDGTERVIQLNRSVENQMMSEIEYLTSILYGQLGLSADIMNGTAPEEVMQNYYRRTIDTILSAICQEFRRVFLSKTARTQGQDILYYRDPFALTPTSQIAEIADKFTRNEILSPNEVRSIVGIRPSDDEAANELRNRNLNQSAEGGITPPAKVPE